MSFFPLSVLTSTKKPDAILAKCGRCKLCYQSRLSSPKMRPTGRGRKHILVVGEAPTSKDDAKNRHFSDEQGKLIRDELTRNGLNVDRDCTMTNALICNPPKDRIEKPEMVEWCRPNILDTIKDVDPTVVILLGPAAVKSVIGHLWREDVGQIERWVGFKIPAQKFNAWICPVYNPSFVLRQDRPVLYKLFAKQVKAAVELAKDKPWDVVPDFKKEVRIEFDPKRAARAVEALARGRRPVAFDYETNMLKPDHELATIVCCSASDGLVTVAYPWTRETRDATRRLVQSRVPKIASNIKFEERWTRAKLGVGINNWINCLDTMLASHVLDNRPDINSIKFQAFVQLGQESYDDHIKPYLKTRDGGYAINRIKEVNMSDLLLYCGLDSLLEWHVAKLQHKELNRVLKKAGAV